VNIYLKSFISFGLSFLILSAIFHVDPYHQDHHDGYNICSIHCEHEKHHSKLHHCEKCLVKDKKIEFQSTFEICIDTFSISYKFKSKKFEKYSISFNLYSRPPPITYS